MKHIIFCIIPLLLQFSALGQPLQDSQEQLNNFLGELIFNPDLLISDYEDIERELNSLENDLSVIVIRNYDAEQRFFSRKSDLFNGYVNVTYIYNRADNKVAEIEYRWDEGGGVDSSNEVIRLFCEDFYILYQSLFDKMGVPKDMSWTETPCTDQENVIQCEAFWESIGYTLKMEMILFGKEEKIGVLVKKPTYRVNIWLSFDK